MTTQPMLFPLIPPAKIENQNYDVCANRHGGNAESAKALKVIASSKESSRQQVYEYALQRGMVGVTTDEVAEQFETTPNAISGRLTELKALGLLVRTDQTRKTRSGCAARVFRAVRKGSGI